MDSASHKFFARFVEYYKIKKADEGETKTNQASNSTKLSMFDILSDFLMEIVELGKPLKWAKIKQGSLKKAQLDKFLMKGETKYDL